MSDGSDDNGLTNRRVVLGGVGAAGLLGLAGALAACGSDDDTSNSGSGATSPGATHTSAGGSSDDSGGGGDDKGSIAKTTDIPVGGGKIFSADNVVVTQPTVGKFKAFSATCTHENCVVGSVEDGLINCRCHGSQFSIADGSVVTPARGLNKNDQQPLPEKTVTVSGTNLTVG
jgi:nitrite reductase/ring-hydroxylating ferredoxin subunit